MRTNIFTLLLLCIFSALNAQKTYDFSACVTDELGQPLIYADVHLNDTTLVQTDLNGCVHISAASPKINIRVDYPLFISQELELVKGRELLIELKKQQTGQAAFVELQSSLGKYLYKGKILDEATKEPLIAASIQIKDSPYGTLSDLDGNFELYSNRECEQLIINYTGFEQKEQKACKATNISIGLTQIAVLEEVSVVELKDSVGAKKRRRKRESSPSMSPMLLGATAEYEAAEASPAASKMEYMSADEVLMKEAYDELAEDEELQKAGQLTAGELNDFTKWDMWADISQEDLAMHRSTWNQFADHRYTVQLTNDKGYPVVKASLELIDGQGNVLWKAKTNNKGRAELWAHYFDEKGQAARGLHIRGNFNNEVIYMADVKPFEEGINFYSLKADCQNDPMIDIAFVVDATGSMGDEIHYLQAEMLNVIERIQDSLPAADIQTASVFYKDLSDDYVTKTSDFNTKTNKTLDFIKSLYAGGGGDFPEAVDMAMQEAVEKLAWREQATSKILFLLLDAPPHENTESMKRLQVAVSKAAAMGIQIIPVACSGINKSTEYLMRSMALATNGTYTFLTDHSGIGNAHIEPSTDDYTVEYLNDVMVRVSVERSRLEHCSNRPIAVVGANQPNWVENTESKWSYYPNPSSGPLNFEFDQAGGTLYLADAQGKLLQRMNVQQSFEVNLSNYPAANYWLKYQDSEGRWSQGQLILIKR